MKKSKITLIALSMIISFGLFIVFLNHADNKRNAERSQKEAERLHEEAIPIIEDKKLAYDSYVESIDGIIDSEDMDDRLEVYILSLEKLTYVFGDGDIEGVKNFKKTKEGDEHLEVLKEEATKNLNDAIHDILKYESKYTSYDYLKQTTGYYDAYMNEENSELYDKLNNLYASQTPDSGSNPITDEMLKLVLRTGLSEKEVKSLLVSTHYDVFKSSEAEFWSIDDIVLTMKNGYVYEIHYAD